jgi:hypothetical protein
MPDMTSVPSGVAPEAMVVARNTLGGAAAVAERLSDPLRVELLGAAREAFTRAFALTAGICAAMALAAAMVAAMVLRRVRWAPGLNQGRSLRWTPRRVDWAGGPAARPAGSSLEQEVGRDV